MPRATLSSSVSHGTPLPRHRSLCRSTAPFSRPLRVWRLPTDQVRLGPTGTRGEVPDPGGSCRTHVRTGSALRRSRHRAERRCARRSGRREQAQVNSRSTLDRLIPSIVVPMAVTSQRLSTPNCESFSSHHDGVSRPRWPPKSDGHVQSPSGVPLIQTEMSLGQSRSCSGASLQTSAVNCSDSTRAPGGTRFGNRYSTYPARNQSSCAVSRSGS